MDLDNWISLISPAVTILAVLATIQLSNRSYRLEQSRHQDANVERITLIETKLASLKIDMTDHEEEELRRLDHLEDFIDEAKKNMGELAIQMAKLAESSSLAWEMIRRLLDNVEIKPLKGS